MNIPSAYSVISKCTLAFLCLLSLNACTTTEIDELRQAETQINSDESIVILGRRQNSNYETEDSFVSCVGDEVSSGTDAINVIPEDEFMDELFPFFEPRTAPMRTEHLQQLMDQDIASERMDNFGLKYIVWLDGLTQRSGQTGSVTCAVSPGGGGCFGFGSWVDDSNFEAEIWDMETLTNAGSISTDSNGQSYVPAIVVPIPLIARVEANACSSLGEQLRTFINGT